MTTILNILAAIVVVGVCLESAKIHESAEYSETGTLKEHQQNTGCHVFIWDGYGYYDLLADPLDVISGDENLSNGDDLLPGGSTYIIDHLGEDD